MATTEQSDSDRTGSANVMRSGGSRSSAERGNPTTTTVRLPFVTAHFHRPDWHLPQVRMPEVRENVTGAVNAVRDNLPPREQIAYFAGLGLLASLALIEWPVAAALGVGTIIAQQSRSGRNE